MGEMRNAYGVLIRKCERKRSLTRPKCRWEDNIGMDFRERAWEDIDWIHLVQIGTSDGLL
jgi:hypothetical protein